MKRISIVIGLAALLSATGCSSDTSGDLCVGVTCAPGRSCVTGTGSGPVCSAWGSRCQPGDFCIDTSKYLCERAQ